MVFNVTQDEPLTKSVIEAGDRSIAERQDYGHKKVIFARS
jgi:hypothetical protein